MTDRVVPASVFKQRCLALLDRVAETGEHVIVTKHGRPVARLAPLEPHQARSLRGSVTFLVDDDGLLSAGERWEAEGDP